MTIIFAQSWCLLEVGISHGPHICTFCFHKVIKTNSSGAEIRKKKSKTWDLEELDGWLGARGAISWKRDEQIKNLRASRFRIFADGARIVRTLPLTKFKQNIGIRGNYKKSDIFAMKRHKRCTQTYRNIFASWSWLGRCHIHQAQSNSSQLISQKRCESEYFK